MRRVLITGAAGSIGRAVAPALPRSWQLELTDRREGVGGILDVTDGDACRVAFAGVDAVVHLAAVADPNASWEQLLPANIVGAYEVARAAIDCGVRRLVLASSVQAVWGYPEGRQVRVGDPPLPATVYGATKAWAEALGGWVASTSSTSVVALRIGNFREERPSVEDATSRDVAAWLSPHDCAELVRCAVEADVSGFVVANGISANRYLAADLSADISATGSGIGYRAQDDAFEGKLARRGWRRGG
jgi:uronate dehydrogenase